MKQKKILIVENDEAMAAIMAHWFRAAGFDVRTADDGMTAWHFLKDNQVDVVITDYSMTLITGSQLCEMMRSDERHSRTPILLITGKHRGLDVNWLQKEYDVVDVLTKPFSMQTLVSVVKSALGMPADDEPVQELGTQIERG